MYDYLKRSAEQFWEDVNYQGGRAGKYMLGKMGITGVGMLTPTLMSNLFSGLAPATIKSTAGLVVIPASAGLSIALVQNDHIHRRTRILNEYRTEIGAWLKKDPKQVDEADMYAVAFGDAKKGIARVPALTEALTQSRKERNWGIGISSISTLVGTLAVMAMKSMPFMQDVSVLGYHDPAVMAISGAVAFAAYQAIKLPLHWLAEQAFGIERVTIDDRVRDIARDISHGREISQEKVFGAYLEAHPEMDKAILDEYGSYFYKLPRADKHDILRHVGPALNLPQMTDDLNAKLVRPEELAFAVFGQVSGVKRGVSEAVENPREGLLSRAWNNCVSAWHHLQTKRGKYTKAEITAVTAPQNDAQPAFASVAMRSPDGREQVALQAADENRPGRHASFVEMVGRSDNGQELSFVQQLEESRTGLAPART